MSRSLAAGGWGALIGRLGDGLADTASFSLLLERLARHGADLSGQLQELLLRSPGPATTVRS